MNLEQVRKSIDAGEIVSKTTWLEVLASATASEGHIAELEAEIVMLHDALVEASEAVSAEAHAVKVMEDELDEALGIDSTAPKASREGA